MQERGIHLALEPEAEPTTDSDVFYNTDVATNRDISTACLAVHAAARDGELRVCDALAASGIRGLRYLDEVDGIEELLLNDISAEAVANIEENLSLNEDLDGDRVAVSRQDATLLLAQEFRGLDYVDVDPFGSPAPHLDAAARAVRHEGLAGFTATDLGPLYGSYPKVCRRRYAATPMKIGFGHELGLRILVKEVFQAFARYDHAFTPIAAWHEQHYSRVVGRVEESKQQCNGLLDSIGHLSACRDCRWRGYERTATCPGCGGDVETAGPLWTGPLGDTAFLDDVAAWLDDRGYGAAHDLVATLRGEADIAVPFYDTHELASAAGVQAPGRATLLERVREQGYRAVPTHFSPQGVRTDAPLDVLHAAVRGS
ncbi:MAG: tRNA (guanine(10)-N(2))-dimethyltransferase [Candidatus Nanohaloarchaea archaeon]|nr:tRNA (guanine(10)-N(2))-dimethyltransferase [Candidatus Nanohaloarchaea archaeon]